MSTHLGEVAHDVEAFAVVLRHDVEEEGVCVIVQRLVVKETLGQKTQVLGVTLVLTSIDLKEGYGALAINLVAWRMPQVTLRLRKRKGSGAGRGGGVC